MSKTVTIKDVAAKAQVSVGTVSRVLAGHGSVKAPLVARVNAAISELGYRPNVAARAMRAKHVNVIGLIVPDITNPFFAQLADKLEQLATSRGHALMVSSSRNAPEHEARQFAALCAHQPRAILVVPAADERLFDLPDDTPVLALDRPSPGLATIGVDHAQSAGLALDHLVELGHRSVVYIGGPRSTVTGRLRRQGVEDRAGALRAAGVDLTLRVVEGAFDFQSGEGFAGDILSSADRPTAIFAANDQVAIGVLRTARDMGLKVPAQLSVVGFDDIDLAALVVPRLTTIRQPVDDLAEAAMAHVFRGTETKAGPLLMARLVVRQSTSAAP